MTINDTHHTKGPWRFSTCPQPNGCPIVGARGLMICMLAHSVNEESQKKEALANAALITAAPELLEALLHAEDRKEYVQTGNYEIVIRWIPRMAEMGLTDPYKAPEQNVATFISLQTTLRRAAIARATAA